MMRSLFAGVAGLKTHQTRMDVIGNNIANVNTTAYKSQSMTFSDLMYQTTQAASGANAVTGVGGINARQIGLGSKTSAIKTAISGQGATQTTNDPFDLMITGDAFFIVSKGNASGNYFTRDGSFYVDGRGNLAMTSTGYNVMGWQVDETTGEIKKDTVSALRIMTEANMTYPAEATTQATVSGVVDKYDTDINSPEGRMMNLEIYDNQGYMYTVRMSVHAVDGDAGDFYVKMDDLLDSNGKSVMYTYDDQGLRTDTKTDLGNAITFGGDITAGTDENGQPITVEDAVSLKFTQGKGTFEYVGAAGSSSTILQFATGGAAANFTNVTIDFSATGNYNVNGVSTIGALKGGEGGLGSGRPLGEMSGISIAKDGLITASYDNGQSRTLGQIAVATFPNPSGLSKEGDNLYAATMNSGDFDGIGQDITEGGGYMNSGVLEMSNVDLSSEFTEMITTQRGFQANSRIITVSDTLLEELTNLKR
ncbi:MAG: flagellar hook-basal body complex protein [Bacillota bacterium]|nr:flagellar hook-basal body complex protein [Bacillota bacterium]